LLLRPILAQDTNRHGYTQRVLFPAGESGREERQGQFSSGLLLGLGFLALFLLLETAMDTNLFAFLLWIILAFLAMVGLSGFNIWLFIRDRR
jgi:hypothetical protein